MSDPSPSQSHSGVWDRPATRRRPGSSWRFVKVHVLFLCPDNVEALLLLAMLDQAPALGGVTISRASHESEATKLLNDTRFDVILILDSPTGALNAMEVLRIDEPLIPIVIVSPSSDETAAIRAIQAGAQDFLMREELSASLLLRALRYAVERFRLHLELRSLSLTDELTNLNNRRGFFTLAEQMRKQAVRQRQRLVLFYADLDGLKGINDRFGHSEGDLVIAEAGRLLNATFRESDLVCRIGGDEFVVLTIEDENGIIENAIGRIADRIAEWNRLRDTGPKLSMSVGVSCFEPQDRRSLEAALTSADAELYRQKRLKSRQQPPRDQASALAPMGESI